ncbi:MAG: long-chain-acyl-CoA synthetase [Hyphomonadaceae bacterium]
MSLLDRIRREWALLSGFARTLWAYRGLGRESLWTAPDDLERSVDRFAERPAFRFEGETLTYAEFDALANRVAHWARAEGLKRGEVVALLMHNRPLYLAVWMGLAKVGCVAALLNTGIVNAQLAHCIAISGARRLILEPDLASAYAGAAALLQEKPALWASGGAVAGAADFDAALAALSPARIPRTEARGGLTGGDLCLLVFTSGTTGAPKAARMPHWRVQNMLRAFIGAAAPTAEDRNYVALPLYHSTGGLTAIGLMLERGGCVILAAHFSARQFWSDIRAEGATMFFYVGEMCRYLLNQPGDPRDSAHKVRLIIGNGLRPDIWRRFQQRFAIPKIVEFYGSTEGNVQMANLDNHVGAVGRYPDYLRALVNVRVIKFDVEKEEPIRGSDGFCIEAAPDEAGEAIGEIKTNRARYGFEGYTGDPVQTAKKILRDAFAKGDAWFRTGDLMRRDKDGYFYFVDRLGDTFRWRGENVSAGEVAEILTGYPGVKEAIVYGVHVGGMEGRAGMAAITPGPDFALDALHDYATRTLAPFARPLFLRIRPEMETTGTFKYRKGDLVADGFDPDKTADPIYFDDPESGGYVRVTPEVRARIEAGGYRI